MLLPDPMFHSEEKDEERHPWSGFENEELCHQSIHLVVDIVVAEAARDHLQHRVPLRCSKFTSNNHLQFVRILFT